MLLCKALFQSHKCLPAQLHPRHHQYFDPAHSWTQNVLVHGKLFFQSLTGPITKIITKQVIKIFQLQCDGRRNKCEEMTKKRLDLKVPTWRERHFCVLHLQVWYNLSKLGQVKTIELPLFLLMHRTKNMEPIQKTGCEHSAAFYVRTKLKGRLE